LKIKKKEKVRGGRGELRMLLGGGRKRVVGVMR